MLLTRYVRPHWLPFFFYYRSKWVPSNMEANGVQQQSGYQHSSKHVQYKKDTHIASEKDSDS